jgi:hypothetical protein
MFMETDSTDRSSGYNEYKDKKRTVNMPISSKTETAAYALFLDGKQVTKEHSTKHAVIIEAYEKRLVMRTTPDFGEPETYNWLPVGYKIKEVADV